MANELRTRTNFVGGLVEDNPLTNVATTLTSAGLAALPVIDTTNHAALILDPDGIHGAPEIVWVTAHSASSTTATILRAQESTSARQHLRDTYWVHTATVRDFEGAFVGTKVTFSVTQSIPSATWTVVNFDTESYDTSNWHDNAVNNSRITLDRTGFYEMSGLSSWASNQNGTRYMAFTLNGSRIQHLPDDSPSSALFSHHYADIRQFTAGDYLELSVYQDSGGNLNLNVGTFFIVRYLGS